MIAKQQAAYRKARRNGEYQLTCAVAQYLDAVLDPASARYSHIPNGERRDARTGAKLKKMGVKPGWADFAIVYGYGPLAADPPATIFIELKNGSGLSQSQKDFAAWCQAVGQPYHICKSIDDVKAVLAKHQVPVRGR